MSVLLHDMHCHIGFMKDPASFMREADVAGSCIFAVTITPWEFEKLQTIEGSADMGLGLHPWWVPDREDALEQQLHEFDKCFPSASFIGEVGLDFSTRRVHTKDLQVKAMEHIARRSAQGRRRAVSIHCVHAYKEMLSLLEFSGMTQNCLCIFHWFSGSNDHLQQAKRLGCYFSVSERMLATKRGREYAKAIPEDRLLLETDAPPISDRSLVVKPVDYTYEQVRKELTRTLETLADLRKQDKGALAASIQENVLLLHELKE